MTRKIFLTFFFSILLTSFSFANTYYISPTGYDTNNGLSWSQAWRTITKVNSTLAGGDTIFFAPGTYRGQIIPPAGGRSSDRTAYISGNGIDKTPTKGSARIYGSDQITNWSLYSGSIYRASWTPSGTLSNDHFAWTLAQNDSLLWPKTSLTAVTVPGTFYHDYTNAYIYAWCYGSQDPDNFVMEGSARPVIFINQEGRGDHTTFWGFDLRYGSHKVVLFGDAAHPDSCFIDHCSISRVAGPGNQNTACVGMSVINIADSTRNGHWNRLRSCTLSHSMDAGDFDEHQKGLSLYQESYFTIESCYVGNQIGLGIDFKNQLVGPTTVGNVARYNIIRDCNSQGINIYCHALEDSIYGNIIYNIGDIGISLKSLNVYGKIAILNNTIYNTSKGIATGYEGFTPPTNYLKYNLIYGGSEKVILMGGDHETFIVDSNIYYSGTISFRTTQGSFNLTSWRSTYGFDLNSSTTNPGLINPAAGNFARSDSLNFEMNADYGGRRWTLFGAWQPGNQPDCDPPGATTLTSPANGATGLTQPLTFDWQDVATATLYQIQIDDNVAFNSPEIDAFATASSFNTSGLTAGATYHWRIKAYNACGGGNWSVSRNFTTYCEQIGAPDIALPVDGADNQTQPVNLDWNSVTGADQYHVQVDDNPDFSSPERDQQTTASNYSVSGLADGTTYYWKVCAHNACGWGNWSTTSSFTTFSFATQTFDIYDLEVLNITDTSALIEWKTTEEATSRVEYGTTAGYGLSSPLSTGLQMVHSILLTQLNQDTDYHFRVVCTNADDELSISPDSSFHTRSTISGNGSTLTGSSNTAYGALEPTLRVNNYDNNDDNVYYFEVAEDSSFALLVESSPAVLQEDGEVTSWQVTEELNIGQTYYWRANVNNLVYSPVYTFVIHPKTYAMPNPYRPDSDPPATFANVPSGSNLVIMSVSGNEVIKRWTNHSGGDILWDGTNQAGNHVASQTYLWFVENTNIKGKIIVIR